MRLTFGKFRGWAVEDLTDSYLQWLFFQDFLKPDVERAVKNEVADRWPDKIQVKALKRDASPSPVNGNAVKSIYRELALKYHPDQGGNTAAMQAINEFMEKLRGVICNT